MGCCSGGNGAVRLGGTKRKTRECVIRKGRMVLAILFMLVSRGNRSNDDGTSRSEGMTTDAGHSGVFVLVN
jgi:hypothetical protein